MPKPHAIGAVEYTTYNLRPCSFISDENSDDEDDDEDDEEDTCDYDAISNAVSDATSDAVANAVSQDPHCLEQGAKRRKIDSAVNCRNNDSAEELSQPARVRRSSSFTF